MTADDGLRAEAERIVANWRVNFDTDDDRPLVNMIDAALRAKAAAADRVRECVDGMDPIEVALGGLMYVYGEIRRALDGQS